MKFFYDENLSPSLVPVLADVYIRDLGLQSFLDGAHPKIIWIGLGNCSTRQIAELLRTRWSQIEEFSLSEEGDRPSPDIGRCALYCYLRQRNPVPPLEHLAEQLQRGLVDSAIGGRDMRSGQAHRSALHVGYLPAGLADQ